MKIKLVQLQNICNLAALNCLAREAKTLKLFLSSLNIE